MANDFFDVIRRDLSSFADTASQVEVSERGARWRQQRKTVEVTFVRGQDLARPDIQIDGRQYGYREFFASERMADLRGLAETIPLIVKPPPVYVTGSARQVDEEATDAPADALLRRLCKADLPFLRTQVVFLRGPAGAGKTALLRHLAVDQAGAFLDGRETFLYLYIDAQGRALSRLDEAASAVLDDLRAPFTYHAVATLTRMGLIVPIIDGFDELLGVGGYQEAFSSLAAFLARLAGDGALIASARGTFYTLSDLERSAGIASRDAMNFEIAPVDLLEWGDTELRTFVALSGGVAALRAKTPEEAVGVLKEKVGTAGSDLLGTPFFANAVLDLVTSGKPVPAPNRVIRDLVQLFVEREVEKIKDTNEAPVLTAAQHLDLLALIAEEMWWQGVRELDPGTIETIAELASEQFGISLDAARILKSKVPAHALLTLGTGRQKLQFTHEYFYAYSLARRLSDALKKNAGLPAFLGRGFLSPVVAQETVSVFEDSAGELAEAVARIGATRSTPLTKDVVRANAGMLYASSIRQYGLRLENTTFSDAAIDGADLRGSVLVGATFLRCDVNRVDLRGAKWTAVRLRESVLSLPSVDVDATALGLVEIRVPGNVQGLVLINAHGQESVFAPKRVTEVLRRLGATVLEPDVPPVDVPELSRSAQVRIDALKKLLRMAGRKYGFSQDDLENKGIAHLQGWDRVEELLRRHNLLATFVMAKRGPSGTMSRLSIAPQELERAEAGLPADPRAVAFWRELIADD